MSDTLVGRRRFRPGRLVVIGACLAGVGIWLAVAEYRVRRDFDRAKAALQGDDPAAARPLLDRYLASRPSDAEAHFRAAQAARRCGDIPAAEQQLAEADRLKWQSRDIELERAMIQTQSGNLAQSEFLLVAALNDGHAESPQILEVLVPCYMADFRWFEAGPMADKWTELKPGSARAWKARGEIAERRLKKNDAVNAYREAVRLAPDDHTNQISLARMLIETRQAGEAAEHLQRLTNAGLTGPTVTVLLGLCREAQGKLDEAKALFDRAIAEFPSDPLAHYHRGRIELNRHPELAAPFLRRAAELDASDPQILYSLMLCVRDVGTADEVRDIEARWSQCNTDLKRVVDVARQVSRNPRDADLRCEMGEIFLRNGREADGLRWLESALREQPDHEATHRLLAEHYERKGRSAEAAHHRSFLQLTDPSGK
jgi:predicted Zn-dependent protease